MADLTAEFVIGAYQWAVRQPQERELRSFIRDVRQMNDIKHRVVVPREYRKIAQEVRTGQTLLRDVAARITASLTKEPPVYQVYPRDDTVDTKRAASIAGRWLEATTADMTRFSPVDIIFQSAGALVLDSESVIKVVHRPAAWANFPEREDGEDPKKYSARADKHARGNVANPFAWRQVDRLQMVFGDGEFGDDWCIEYGEYATPYLAHDVRPDPQNPTPETHLAGPPTYEASPMGHAAKTVKLEYFDARQWMVTINGKAAPGFPKENPYAPYLPYMRTVAPPAMYPLKSLAPALDALETMLLNLAYLTAFPVVVIEAMAQVQQLLNELPTGNTTEPPHDVKVWHPGEAWFPPPGYTMRFLEPPRSAQELLLMKNDIREMMDIVGVPTVFRGQGGTRQAGYSINQLMAAAQMTYKKLVEGLQRQQENVARFLFNCVGSTTGQTIYVLASEDDAKKWLGLKPSGEVQQYVAPVDALGPPECRFRPVLPTDEQAMLMMTTQALNAPVRPLSHETMLTRLLQVDDPQGELDRIAAETMLEAPSLQMDIELRARQIAGLPPPAGMGSPQGMAPPAQLPAPNDAVNRGEPTIRGVTQPMEPNQPLPTINPRQGGRAPGTFPGQPGGPNGR